MTWRCAAIFGASGGIGAALCEALIAGGIARIHAGSRSGSVPAGEAIRPFSFDLTNETSIAQAAAAMADDPPDLVIVATGVLILPADDAEEIVPERSYRELDGAALLEAFALNTIGPALIAKHMLPMFPRNQRSLFAALSARVGSIGDNRLGGWHSYRASKAALNMLVRNLAIELSRTHRQAIVVGLHPGTVDTTLSAPFQSNLPAGQLTAPDAAATNLLQVIDGLRSQDSGQVFDWKSERVPD